MTNIRLNRRQVVSTLLSRRGSALVVSGLGSPTYDVASVGDSLRNFYLWGAMGGAALCGLGLALAQPKEKVIVVTGDGEMLMGLGGLATIGVQRPANLSIIVLDNERYGETGGQKSHTAHQIDIVGIAASCGFPVAKTLSTEAEVEALEKDLAEGEPVLRFISVKVDAGTPKKELPTRDGVFLKNRMRRELGFGGI